MARPDTRQATETLEEVNSVFDRAADWVLTNPTAVLSVLGGILAIAAMVGLIDAYNRSASNQAAAAVAEIQAEYLDAMGATPGSLEIPEPANPEAVQGIREEYVKRFLEAASEHEGSVAAVSALMEAATIQDHLGDPEAGLETLERAAANAASGTALEGLVLERLGQALEDAGRSDDAANAYERAGAIEALPSRKLALLNAARVHAANGSNARALEVFAMAEAIEGGDAPDHLVFRLKELQAQAAQ